MNKYIPVIDLFAGPGGLGEGFSAFHDSNGNKPFKIALSIEKDASAHKTLELRSFFREFNDQEVTEDYYAYLRGNIARDELFNEHPQEATKAKTQAWLCELGKGNPSNEEIDQRIKTALNNKKVWALIGGPPCQAYSIVGRSRNHKIARSEFEKDKRHFLYKEYLRIVAVHKPPVFIMENVKGILSSKIGSENIFSKILFDLRDPWKALNIKDELNKKDQYLNYHIYSLVKIAQEDYLLRPTDYVIKSEKFGIPQKRHRVILLGIRSDILTKPTTLNEATYERTIDQTICDLPKLRSGVSKEKDSPCLWKSILDDLRNSDWINDNHVDSQLRDLILSEISNINSDLSLGSRYIHSKSLSTISVGSIFDPHLNGVCNHMARKHMRSDLYRYFFASCFAKLNKRSPNLSDFPKEILPHHKNIDSAIQGKMFPDRFRVQISGKPSTTIMSHISKDGHYYIHPDPTQCRSLTVREAARLQTFPDNYFFEGNQTTQYQQVGNAVPPFLATQIAEIVNNVLYRLSIV
jgi:DNA (cytosine-5)-methyltransferase 1